MVHLNQDYKNPSSDVVIIAIDEKSIAKFGRWPWDRSLQAELISAIKLAHPKVIGLDIVYSSTQNKDVDNSLARAIKDNGDNIIGGYFFGDTAMLKLSKQSLDIFKNNNITAIFGDNTQINDDIFDIETNVAPIQQAFDSLGFFNYIPNADGLMRRIPLIWNFEQKYYPSLALQAVSKFNDKPIIIETNTGDITNIKVGKNTIPVNRNGKMVLDFYEYENFQSQKNIPIYSASDIIEGKFVSDLRSKIIFIGVTELGIADVRPTPTHNSFVLLLLIF